MGEPGITWLDDTYMAPGYKCLLPAKCFYCSADLWNSMINMIHASYFKLNNMRSCMSYTPGCDRSADSYRRGISWVLTSHCFWGSKQFPQLNLLRHGYQLLHLNLCRTRILYGNEMSYEIAVKEVIWNSSAVTASSHDPNLIIHAITSVHDLKSISSY